MPVFMPGGGPPGVRDDASGVPPVEPATPGSPTGTAARRFARRAGLEAAGAGAVAELAAGLAAVVPLAWACAVVPAAALASTMEEAIRERCFIVASGKSLH